MGSSVAAPGAEDDIAALGDAIANLTLKQAKELSDYLEQIHGIKASAGVVEYQQPTQPQVEKAPEKTEFDVVLDSFGDNKIAIIKVVRTVTGLGLKEAKDLVESAPCKIKEAMDKEAAESLKKELEAAGGAASLK